MRRADGEEPIAAARDVADWSDMADERVLRSQLRRRVFRAILALPAIYRAPVMLRDIQGMSTEEASAMLRVKDQTLKSRLHRGRLILRKQLADFAGGLHAPQPCYGMLTAAGCLDASEQHRVVERHAFDDAQRRHHHFDDSARAQSDRQRRGPRPDTCLIVGCDEAGHRPARVP